MDLVLALVVALDVEERDCLCRGVVSAVRASAFLLALRRLGFGRVLFLAMIPEMASSSKASLRATGWSIHTLIRNPPKG
jgi:hypothetical protein